MAPEIGKLNGVDRETAIADEPIVVLRAAKATKILFAAVGAVFPVALGIVATRSGGTGPIVFMAVLGIAVFAPAALYIWRARFEVTATEFRRARMVGPTRRWPRADVASVVRAHVPQVRGGPADTLFFVGQDGRRLFRLHGVYARAGFGTILAVLDVPVRQLPLDTVTPGQFARRHPGLLPLVRWRAVLVAWSFVAGGVLVAVLTVVVW